MRNINCIFADNPKGICINEKIKKSFFGHGARLCEKFENSKAPCSLCIKVTDHTLRREVTKEDVMNDEIKRKFQYRELEKKDSCPYVTISSHAEELAQVIEKYCPNSIEKNKAIDKIQESMMWAHKAMTHGKNNMPIHPIRCDKCVHLHKGKKHGFCALHTEHCMDISHCSYSIGRIKIAEEKEKKNNDKGIFSKCEEKKRY